MLVAKKRLKPRIFYEYVNFITGYIIKAFKPVIIIRCIPFYNKKDTD